MKRVGNRILLLAVLLSTTILPIFATISFGSRDASLNFSTGTKFNIGSTNLTIDGTLKEDVGVDVSGNSINFANGILESAGLEALMNGEYDPTGADFIRLNGSGRFRAEPGKLIHSLTVAGINNSIEGQPLFSDSIVLADASTELNISMQNRLNQNLQLNGGKITLDDDLGLADNIKIIGNGRVELNSRQLRLGSVYTTSWFNSLYFNNAADVVLNCELDLTGSWTFGGMSCLCGSGGVLDLSKGGQIIIDNNSTLDITDIHIKGLGNDAGKIIMRNGASLVRTANSSYKLDNDFTTSQGRFYVFGPTTFQVGQKTWAFRKDANLTVDGTTLWVDPLDSPCWTGGISAPRPLFDEMGANKANLLFDLASGNLSLINRGTIKEVVDISMIDFCGGACQLLSGEVCGEIDLCGCLCMGPDDRVNIICDSCIDGHGMAIEFSNQPFAQLVIRPGVTVLWKNITLRGINDRTIDMRDNSVMQFAENVILELDTDVTFSSNGVIKVLNGANACSPITNPNVANILKIRGETCRRAFRIEPLDDQLTNGRPRKTFDLGHNTVMLENAELSGFDHISFFNDDMFSAAVALSCNAAVDIDSNFLSDAGTLGTAMNFFVEGINNDMILRKDGLILYGNITFGDFPDNELHVRFNLASFLAASDPARAGVLTDFPFAVLAGDPGIFLFSEEGVAELFFDDFNAAVRNANDNAFVVDDNGLLGFKRLQLIDNPIKQQSARFRFEGIELLDQRIDPSFIRKPRLLSNNILITAMHVMRQREKDLFAQAQKQARERAKTTVHGYQPNNAKWNKKRPQPKHRDEISLEGDELLGQVVEDGSVVRALSLPVSFDQTYVGLILDPTTPISGNIQYNNTEVNNFLVDPNLPFNILMQHHSTITLGADVVLNQNHKINVKGTGNVIVMPFGMTIGSDNLFLEEGAELTFLFPANITNAAELVIADNTKIDIEPNAVICLSGEGMTTLGNRSVINFKGVKTVNPLTKVETVSSRGHLIVTENAELRVASGGTARMRGVGNIEISKRGKIYLDAPSSLIFGIDDPSVMVIIANVDPIFPAENFHDIIFNVFDNGEVILRPNVQGEGRARISFRYLTSTILFESDGFLLADNNGTFEINAKGSTPLPSRLKALSLRDGNVQVRGTGRFAMGSNKINIGTGKPYPFSYDGVAAQIAGTGRAQYIAGANSFDGLINPTADAFEEIAQHTALNLIRSFIGLSQI